MKADNGGPAFPSGAKVRARSNPIDPGSDFVETSVIDPMHPGMTLRDYFAAKVVQAMMTHPSCPEQINATGLSQAAYEIADEMIKVGK